MKNEDSDILDQQGRYYGSYLKIKDNPRYRKIWDFIKRNNLRGRLLDIGCANGDFSEPLVENGFDCFGLEIMEEGILESQKKGIKVSRGSFLERFPFGDNYFDVVFAGEVIEHTVDDENFLKEVSRVLKKDGVLILTTPNLVSFGNRLLMLFGEMPRFAYSEFHYRIYNKKLIANKIKIAGFRVEKFESNYVLVSTFFSKSLGVLGEQLGTFFPRFGENFVIYARKK